MQRFTLLILLLLLGACAGENSYDNPAISEPESEDIGFSGETGLDNDPGNLETPAPGTPGAHEPTQQPDTSLPQSARLTAQEADARISLRVQPSSQSSDKGYGLVGDPVQVLNQAQGDDGWTWYWVKFDGSGAEGWIRSDFIEIVTSANSGDVSIRTGVAEAALLTSQQVNELVNLDSFSKDEYDWKTLSPEYSEQGNGNPYGIILPTNIPPGFELTQLTVERMDDDRGPGGYVAEYCNSTGQCFAVYAATGGLGAGSEEYQISEVHSPALGTVKVGYTEFSQSSSAPEALIWVSQGKMNYFFNSPSSRCEQAVSFPEATRIVASLDYLNPVPGGYPPTEQWEPWIPDE